MAVCQAVTRHQVNSSTKSRFRPYLLARERRGGGVRAVHTMDGALWGSGAGRGEGTAAQRSRRNSCGRGRDGQAANAELRAGRQAGRPGRRPRRRGPPPRPLTRRGCAWTAASPPAAG